MAVVGLTVILVLAVPARVALGLFAPLALWRSARPRGPAATSTVAALVLAGLVWAGLAGTSDPAHNVLPVFVWTLFWVLLVVVQGLFGDVWRWLNPWTGPLALARRAGLRPLARLPAGLGHWPALAFFLVFSAFHLVHPTPSDPQLLARAVAAWWGLHFALALVFGPRWLRRGEALTALLGAYAGLGLFGTARGRRRAGFFGWQAVAARRAPDAGLAVLMIAALAAGSFDGLYETFFWLSLTGVNPLEFPGRSAVWAANLGGLLGSVLALSAVYALCLAAGLRLAGAGGRFGEAFRAFAPALMPIALAYHVAHYLPAFLVEVQAVPIVLNDPLGAGVDLLGLGHMNVTTGFFNRLDSVRRIWLTQAGAVVLGHVVAVLLAHALALRLFGDDRRATRAGAPLALFMVGYTQFGLWLLASPRGI